MDETITAVPALLTAGNKVLVAYDTGFVMPVRLSTDGGRTFSEPHLPLGETITGFTPAACADGSDALLACTNYDFLTSSGTLFLMRSRDWSTWREAGTREIRSGRPYGLSLVVAGGKRIAILIDDKNCVSAVTL